MDKSNMINKKWGSREAGIEGMSFAYKTIWEQKCFF